MKKKMNEKMNVSLPNCSFRFTSKVNIQFTLCILISAMCIQHYIHFHVEIREPHFTVLLTLSQPAHEPLPLGAFIYNRSNGNESSGWQELSAD